MPNTSQNTEEPTESIYENTIALCINITTCALYTIRSGVRQYLNRSLDNFKLIYINFSLELKFITTLKFFLTALYNIHYYSLFSGVDFNNCPPFFFFQDTAAFLSEEKLFWSATINRRQPPTIL